MAVSYTNSDAEHSLTCSYLLKIPANIEAYIEIGMKANCNYFLKVKSRLREYSSVEVPLNLKCIMENAYYKVTAKIQLQLEIPRRVDIAMKRDVYTQSNLQGVIIRTSEKFPDSSVILLVQCDSKQLTASSQCFSGESFIVEK